MAKYPCRKCVYFNQCGSLTRTEYCEGRKTTLNICRIRNNHGVGEVSSKYGYDKDGSQFEADIQRHHEEYEALYQDFVGWMKSKDVDPRKFRSMFTRYYEEFMK